MTDNTVYVSKDIKKVMKFYLLNKRKGYEISKTVFLL